MLITLAIRLQLFDALQRDVFAVTFLDKWRQVRRKFAAWFVVIDLKQTTSIERIKNPLWLEELSKMN